jgi:hypothetical protein
MSVRETINKNPRVTGIVAGCVVLLAIGAIFWQGLGSSNSAANAPLPKTYFTVDDGKTFFPDLATRVPPFTTADGKTAYRVRVIHCASTGKLSVAHLEKFSEADRQRLEANLKDPKAARVMAEFSVGTIEPNVMVKKPLTGDRGWVTNTPQTARQYEAIIQAKCPDGTPAVTISPR